MKTHSCTLIETLSSLLTHELFCSSLPNYVTSHPLNLLCRYCVLSVTEDDHKNSASALSCALCDVTCAHCVTSCEKYLVVVLSKSCAIIMFGIQMLQCNVIKSGF